MWNTGEAASFIAFPAEEDAEEFVVETMRPYCKSIVRQPRFKNGMRPDIGMRLLALPELPFVVETKRFTNDTCGFSAFVDGIAQASSYGTCCGTVSFIAPIRARNATQLGWFASPIGAAMLLAGQFNVGTLTFVRAGDKFARNTVGALHLAGCVLATFLRNEYGDPETILHKDAARLLTLKSRVGSKTWRRTA